MKFAAKYIRQRCRSILFYLTACMVFGAMFALYHLPMQAVIYPVLLCALLAVVWMIADVIREFRRHKMLLHAQNLSAALMDDLPPAGSIEEEDYQNIIRMLCAQQQALETQLSTRYSDMIDYYTLWAHQIKTPIASMRLQLQNEDSSLSRSLRSELLRVEQYVEMVLAYLRLGSSSTDYVIRECDLDVVLRSCIRRFSGEFISRKLRLDYSPLNLKVVSDEKWLAFVIEQILSNALKYTCKGGISIFLSEPSTLCIKDTGIGIAAEDLPRIFENGFTGLNGRSDKKASGLGLHLCRRICGKLNHRIWVESTPDQGTSVYIDLTQSQARHE